VLAGLIATIGGKTRDFYSRSLPMTGRGDEILVSWFHETTLAMAGATFIWESGVIMDPVSRCDAGGTRSFANNAEELRAALKSRASYASVENVRATRPVGRFWVPV